MGVGSTTTQRLPYFTGVGTVGAGKYHSFTTKRTVISGEISQNIVTAVTAIGETHGLSLGDTVDLTALPKNTETITVKYDDDNRRAVFNPKTWVAGNVSISDNTITISNHGLKTGDKVIYTSSTPSGGLTNEGIYYVLYYTKDKIRLCATKYNLELNRSCKFSFLITCVFSISIFFILNKVNPELKEIGLKVLKSMLANIA